MRGLQKINHFPGMHAICRKGDLARSLSRMQACERPHVRWTVSLIWKPKTYFFEYVMCSSVSFRAFPFCKCSSSFPAYLTKGSSFVALVSLVEK